MIWRKTKNKVLGAALITSVVGFILVMTSTIDLTMLSSLLYSVWIVTLIIWLAIKHVDNRRKKRELEADGSFDVPPEFQEQKR